MEPGGGGERGFHRNEAISAVQDEEQFYGEDEDYDDLYNDVNVGEGFLHAVHRSDEPEAYPREDGSRSNPLPVPPLHPPSGDAPEKVQIPGIAGDPKIERPANRSGGFHEQGFRGGGESLVGARPPAPLPVGNRPELGQSSGRPGEIQGQSRNSGYGNEGYQRQGSGFAGEARQVGSGPAAGVSVNGGGEGAGGTTLFVGELHWWTTDADLEAEVSKYGQLKEVKFYDEKASGKSKGFCQVDFYDPVAAAACKEGMHGHVFNGRPCVVAFASPHTVRRMGEAQLKNQQMAAQSSALPQKGRGGGGAPMGGNYGRGGGNWGRGGTGNRGPMGNMRNRMGPVGGRGIMGNGGMVAPPPPMLHPGAMLGQGFDPTGFGAAAMGRMGGAYGGFPAGPTTAPFPGLMPSFPPVVAPHVNPAFFGRGGMAAGGVGMWPDPSMGGWGAEEQSSYGEDAASDQRYGEGSHGKDRGPDRDWSGISDRRHDREKDMGPGQEWSERRHHDGRAMSRERDRDWERDRARERGGDRDREGGTERERERERERDRYRDDGDHHGDHYRHRDRALELDDDWDRGRSSGQRSKSREVEHSKRRRLSPG
ncbi:RNA-binding protein cabeza [Cocos nucifera]|uniref:RNA-binding protein cabeza n=1 Tax=Cocos nucifera TaxID=13894 RepID=A0A8K0IPI9_COCNU|nr:RNA-binding protein cabeza [Cocos nucifera]